MTGGNGSGTRLLPCFAIVRRGRLDTFRTLKSDLEEPDVVEVIWDRRVGQRRRDGAVGKASDVERRSGERRGQPPEMWATFGFLVAPQVPSLVGVRR